MAATTAQAGEEARLGKLESSDRHLRRSMSTIQLLFLGVSAQIGSGWLFAVLDAAGLAGPAAIVSWIVAAVLFTFIAFAWMELGTMLPRSGSIVRIPQMTHGAFTGWNMGWIYRLSVVTIPALEAEAVLTYLGGKFPSTGFLSTTAGETLLVWPNGILAGIGLMVLFFAFNVFGARLMAEANRWVTIWKLVIPTVTFCMLFVVLDGSNFGSVGGGGFAPLGIPGIFQAVAAGGIAFSFLGFRQALDFGGEVRNPSRAIPIATLGSVFIPMIIYTLLQVGFLGAINWHSAGLHPGQWAALTTSHWASGPFFKALSAAGVAALATFANLLLADAAISPVGTGWVYLGTTARVGYALSQQRNIPAVLRRFNRFGIPWPALVAGLVVGCVFFVPAPSWYRLVGFISAAAVLTYIMGGASLTVLRRTAPGLRRPYRLRWAPFLAPLGVAASMVIVYWAGYTTLVNLMAAMFIGLPVYTLYGARRRGWIGPAAAWTIGAVFLGAWIYVNDAGGWVLTASANQSPGGLSFGLYDIAFSAAVLFFCAATWSASNPEGRRHLQGGMWLIVLLLATLPLSYYGHFGPLTHAPLGFPWGSLIEIAIAVLSYWWAVASGFATEEIADVLAAQADEPARPANPEAGSAAA